jgi:hypothetical protein
MPDDETSVEFLTAVALVNHKKTNMAQYTEDHAIRPFTVPIDLNVQRLLASRRK